jgi:hypothetical protein
VQQHVCTYGPPLVKRKTYRGRAQDDAMPIALAGPI